MQITGPGGVTFSTRVSKPDPELWGMPPGLIAVYLWPDIAQYVNDTIAALQNPVNSTPAPPAPLAVPVIFSG